MLFEIPLAIWFGIITLLSLFTTFGLGIAMHIFKKPVFQYHKFFAFLTIMLVVIYIIFAVLLWFFGIVL